MGPVAQMMWESSYTWLHIVVPKNTRRLVGGAFMAPHESISSFTNYTSID